MLRKLIQSVHNVCQALEDLEFKEKQSYDGIKEDLERMNSEWQNLEKRTLEKIEETEEYFTKLLADGEPEGTVLENTREVGEQFSKEFGALYER